MANMGRVTMCIALMGGVTPRVQNKFTNDLNPMRDVVWLNKILKCESPWFVARYAWVGICVETYSEIFRVRRVPLPGVPQRVCATVCARHR